MNKITEVVKCIFLGLMLISLSHFAMANEECPFQDSPTEGIYLTDDCTLIPVEEAIAQYLPSAQQGNAASQYQLGTIYWQATTNSAEAFKWFLAAARKGHVKAQTEVGLAYQFGVGVEEDLDKAIYWYKKAAGNGDYRATRNLLAIYDEELDDIR